MSRQTARAQSGSGRTSLYDEITTKIIAELEAGRVPWVQPWGTAAAKAPLVMPKNASTGRFYSGINVLILWGSVIVAETIPMAPAAQKITLSSSRDIPFCPNRTSGA